MSDTPCLPAEQKKTKLTVKTNQSQSSASASNLIPSNQRVSMTREDIQFITTKINIYMCDSTTSSISTKAALLLVYRNKLGPNLFVPTIFMYVFLLLIRPSTVVARREHRVGHSFFEFFHMIFMSDLSWTIHF